MQRLRALAPGNVSASRARTAAHAERERVERGDPRVRYSADYRESAHTLFFSVDLKSGEITRRT